MVPSPMNPIFMVCAPLLFLVADVRYTAAPAR
jgi:hypothetical protein